MNRGYPSFEIDPFSDELLAQPYDYYRTLRDAGPVFELSRYDAVGLARFDDVRVGLNDWRAYTSAVGPAFNEALNAGLEGSITRLDPPEHEDVRTSMVQRLRLGRIREFAPVAEQLAAEMVAAFGERGTFDAVTDLAQPFVTTFTARILGIPEDVSDLGVKASMAAFDALGPMNDRTIEALPVVGQAFEAMARLSKSDMTPSSIAWEITDARERGEIPEALSVALLFNYLGPAFETTINTIGNILWLLARHPEQWQLLRMQPELIGSAINEALRLESPLQIWSRVARQDIAVDGSQIPAGTRVALFLGSANRDERRYPDPDTFDVRRNPADHLAFGNGIHMCVGAPLARLEISSILNELTGKAETIKLAGEPAWRLNNASRGFRSLPIVVE
jgi:cytochrome P450